MKRDLLLTFDISGNNDNFFIDNKEVNPFIFFYTPFLTDLSYPLVGADKNPINCLHHFLHHSNEVTTICPICLACSAFGQKCVCFREYTSFFIL